MSRISLRSRIGLFFFRRFRLPSRRYFLRFMRKYPSMSRLPYRLRLALARIVWRLELIPARVRFYYRRLVARLTRQPQALICTTYDIVTPESASHGDVDSSGWIDETGLAFEPDPYDIAEGVTRADLALEYLREQGYLEPSSSAFHVDVWYTVYGYNQGTREYYETGAEESRSYHLDGFTEAEQASIYEGITA